MGVKDKIVELSKGQSYICCVTNVWFFCCCFKLGACLTWIFFQIIYYKLFLYLLKPKSPYKLLTAGPRCILGAARWPWKHGVALTADRLLFFSGRCQTGWAVSGTVHCNSVSCVCYGCSRRPGKVVVGTVRCSNGFSSGVTPTLLGNVIAYRTVS